MVANTPKFKRNNIDHRPRFSEQHSEVRKNTLSYLYAVKFQIFM